jgi:hypothetical protein
MQDFFFYLKLGWEHIISLNALDHQLFITVLAAAYFYKDWKKILVLVTAFTIGHSITLALSVLDVFHLPSKLVEILIPVTILLTASDNIFFRENQNKLMKINYLLALFFGLIHGMGFANTARIMMSSEENIAVPLLGFNTGLEIGQITVVAIIFSGIFCWTKFLNFNQKYWIWGVSLAAILLSLKMIFDRI